MSSIVRSILLAAVVTFVAASGAQAEAGKPHRVVIQVDQNDAPASFTTRSPYVDLAAPGVDIPVASALDNSYQAEDGTSFSSPMVAGAAAWLWTVRPTLDASQIAEILRRSARDVATPGYDEATGWGVLDMTAGLAAPTPQADSAEPNDDTTEAATLTTAGRTTRTIAGRVMAYEDPIDVYKVWLPARRNLSVRVTADAPISTAVAGTSRTGKTITLTVKNRGAGRSVFLTVRAPTAVRDAAYRLTVKPS